MAEDSNTLYIQGARTTYQKVNGFFLRQILLSILTRGRLPLPIKMSVAPLSRPGMSRIPIIRLSGRTVSMSIRLITAGLHQSNGCV